MRIEKCEACNGNKRILVSPYGLYVECDVCKAKGYFEVPEDKDLCPDCKGKGKVYKLTNIGFLVIEAICEKCSGTGFVDKTE